VLPSTSNLTQYLISPLCALIIVLITFISLPLKESILSISLSILFIYIIISINIYPVLISGWASNRKYALIGALRAVAQTVSYEVRLAVILIFYLRLSDSIILLQLMELNIYWDKIILFLPIVVIWLVSCVAETNRTPFDFAEGESELVSGFNVEYGRLGFALIFMAEYARIFFLSLVFATLFIRSTYLGLRVYLWAILLVRVWIWARSTFPRYRYDKLINLAWKIYLPVVLASIYFAGFTML